MLIRRAAWACGGLTLLLALAGCGGDAAIGEVSGTISYGGKPVEEGAITFTPIDGKGRTGGGEIKDGQYTAKGVAVGRMKVSITNAKVYGYKKLYDTPDSPKQALKRNEIPEKYNEKTELEYEVKPGKNEKNWELPGG